MKTRYLAISLAAAFAYAFSVDADASDKLTWTPPPRPSTPVAAPPAAPAAPIIVAPAGPTINSDIKPALAADLDASQVSKLISEQRAAAAAAAAAKANAAGGNGEGGDGTASLTDASQTTVQGSRNIAVALQLPQPVQLAAMAGVSCPTPQVDQESNYWLWGLHSNASASTNTDACVLLNGYAAYLSMCQFGNADMLLGRLMSSRLAGFNPESVGLPNMTPAECVAFKKSQLPPPPQKSPPPPATKAEPVQPPAPQKISLRSDALFDFDKAELKPEGRAELNRLATTIADEAANIVIAGHTDSRGGDAYNQRLSMRRANAVRAHLALTGISLDRMVAIGKGETEPVADNATDAGRAQNRRVEVQITVRPVSARLAELVR